MSPLILQYLYYNSRGRFLNMRPRFQYHPATPPLRVTFKYLRIRLLSYCKSSIASVVSIQAAPEPQWAVQYDEPAPENVLQVVMVRIIEIPSYLLG
jgi:hypothetical protein